MERAERGNAERKSLKKNACKISSNYLRQHSEECLVPWQQPLFLSNKWLLS